MKELHNKQWRLRCDRCNQCWDTGTRDVFVCNTLMKEWGWVNRKNDKGIWKQYCEKCKELKNDNRIRSVK